MSQYRKVDDGVVNNWDVDNLGTSNTIDVGGPIDFTNVPLHFLDRAMIGLGFDAGIYDLICVNRPVEGIGVRWVVGLMSRIGYTTAMVMLPIDNDNPDIEHFYQRAWTKFKTYHEPETVVFLQTGEELTLAEMDVLFGISS